MLMNIVYTHIFTITDTKHHQIFENINTLCTKALASLCVVGGLVTCTVAAFCGQIQIVQKF
jgi:hypothetical protein